jgi:hypothetical protein
MWQGRWTASGSSSIAQGHRAVAPVGERGRRERKSCKGKSNLMWLPKEGVIREGETKENEVSHTEDQRERTSIRGDLKRIL